MDANTILSRSEHTTFEVVSGQAILIDLNNGTYFSLNELGTQFWEMLDGQQTIGQHAQTLAQEYEVDADMVKNDLLELAGKMAAGDLVASS